MSNNEIVAQLSLAEIIKKKIKRESEFEDLDQYQKFSILEYIKKHKLEIKIFKYKGYDVLTGKFFVYEYVIDEECYDGFDIEEIDFDNFDDFLQYVNFEIYDRTCFYGYNLSMDDIQKYSINVSKLNFDSFVDCSVRDFSFEELKKEESIDLTEKEKILATIQRRIKKFESIDSYEEFLKQYKLFTSKIDSYYSKHIFLSLALEKNKKEFKNYIIELFCKDGRDCGVDFPDLLYYYGVNVYEGIIDNYEGVYSEGTNRKRIREMKEKYELFLDKKTIMQKRGGFDSSLYLYYVNYYYYNEYNLPFMHHTKYFLDFDGFINDLDGNICSCDLSKAPVEIEGLKKYKYNDKTKFPKAKEYQEHIISKIYKDDTFLVEQKWIDSTGNIIKEQSKSFKFFFDFVHYLDGDLSDANLIMCDGIENLKNVTGLKIDGMKVRSEVAKELGLELNEIDFSNYQMNDFSEPVNNELVTTEAYLVEHEKDEDYSDQVAYVSDIHLLHRYDVSKCVTYEDAEFVNQIITDTICDYDCKIKLIAGDVASDFDTYTRFIKVLLSKKKYGFFNGDNQFFVLGNHELWPFSGINLDDIVKKYKSLFAPEHGLYLVHNNLYYFTNEVNEVTTEELQSISNEELRNKLRNAYLIIFGGIGFAGENEKFNACQGIYRNAIDRNEEIHQSEVFRLLYEKVVNSLYDKNVIILTHNPTTDWTKNPIFKQGFVYVNGHNHRNYFYDDGIKRIYADNQIGYKQKDIIMKSLSINMEYDWFSDYKDGVYEIEREDYITFYRGFKEYITFNRPYDKLYMLKHDGVYMFLLRSVKGSLQILNGGAIRNANGYDVDYYYDNMVRYSQSVKMFLSEYGEFQKKVSKDIKAIGGSGKIHGSIVDIDFYNHLYLNPLDGTVTPYFAYSIVDKYVYKNLPSLLKKECPRLYLNYLDKLKEKETSKELVAFNNKVVINTKTVFDENTDIYRISRIMKGLQYTTQNNIIRLWNPNLVNEVSSRNGRLIVTSLINPNARIETDDNNLEKMVQDNSNYETLTTDVDLKNGDKIIHKNFGEGTIIDISNKKRAIIRFKKMEKILNIDYAIANGYISIDKKESE